VTKVTCSLLNHLQEESNFASASTIPFAESDYPTEIFRCIFNANAGASISVLNLLRDHHLDSIPGLAKVSFGIGIHKRHRGDRIDYAVTADAMYKDIHNQVIVVGGESLASFFSSQWAVRLGYGGPATEDDVKAWDQVPVRALLAILRRQACVTFDDFGETREAGDMIAEDNRMEKLWPRMVQRPLVIGKDNPTIYPAPGSA